MKHEAPSDGLRRPLSGQTPFSSIPSSSHRRYTISDIARIAGVSTASVSKVINNKPGVSNSTRERVRQVVETLGWRPSAQAVALSKGSAGAIGFFLNRDANSLGDDPYFIDLLTGIESVLSEYGYWILLDIQRHATVESEKAAYRALGESRRVEGVILSNTRLVDPRFAIIQALDLKAVIVSRPWAEPDLPWVGSRDPGGGIDDALRHLADLGHRRVAYVSGPSDLSHVLYRSEAFLREAGDQGLLVSGIKRTDLSPAAAARATNQLLTASAPPTAIMYDSDILAIAGSQQAAAMGLSTPEDLSVVGHDDYQIGRWLRPLMTTIGQDVVLLGERVAHAILREIGVPVAPLADDWDRLPNPNLVIRESTGTLRNPKTTTGD